MTPTHTFHHKPTPEELNRVKTAGYQVQKQVRGVFSLHFPNGDIEPFVFLSERVAWVFALRHHETTQQFAALWSKS